MATKVELQRIREKRLIRIEKKLDAILDLLDLFNELKEQVDRMTNKPKKKASKND